MPVVRSIQGKLVSWHVTDKSHVANTVSNIYIYIANQTLTFILRGLARVCFLIAKRFVTKVNTSSSRAIAFSVLAFSGSRIARIVDSTE